jgi:hypothetical protein
MVLLLETRYSVKIINGHLHLEFFFILAYQLTMSLTEEISTVLIYSEQYVQDSKTSLRYAKVTIFLIQSLHSKDYQVKIKIL